jgi:outer membrane protein assembly factor BamA
MKKWIVIILLFPCVVDAQEDASKDRVVQTDTVGKGKKVQSIFIPVIFASPETQLAFGAGGQVFFRTKGSRIDTRLSNIFVSAVYTLRKQLFIDLKPQIYFNNESYYLDAALKYKDNSYRFWGIGNDTPNENDEDYRETVFETRFAFLKRLPPFYNFGLQYNLYYHDMLEVEEDGLLATDTTIVGRNGTTLSGLGIRFNLDTRDNTFSPFSGFYVQLESSSYSRVLGSTHSFTEFIIDGRNYFSLGKRSIIAAQAYMKLTYGDVPFQRAARLGGGERGRGYFEGRFIDNHFYAIQGEYRLKLHPRWKAAGFVVVSEVARRPSSFFGIPKLTFGGGIRWQILKSNESLIRADVGVNDNGDVGIYFGINEAF